MSPALLLAVALSADGGSFDWPQWRGPNRDGHSQERDLLKTWPKDGPSVAWTATKLGTRMRDYYGMV